MARQKKWNTPEKRARIGERIKVATTQAGLSLKELAEAAEVKTQVIYQYVRGIISIPPEVLARIAEVTEVPLDYFDPETDTRSTLALTSDTSAGEGGTPPQHDPDLRSRIQAEMRQLKALSEAHNYPKRNRTAYISDLEQMLALARTVENRQQESWILWQLGCARIDSNELEEARQNIVRARELFATENMETHRSLAALDLAVALGEEGAFTAAQGVLEEVVDCPEVETRWRALISLGSLRYRQNDYEGALYFFRRAAEWIAQSKPELREQDGIPLLMTHIADVANATGHYDAAMSLWASCLQKAAADRKLDVFLEALMEIGQCCRTTGRLGEAQEYLKQATILASFLFEDEGRLSIARSLLADTQVMLGALDEAKENARAALRIAHRVRSARGTILATLALGETNLASGYWDNALDHAQEALDEAQRTGRSREVAQAYELRARAYLEGAENPPSGQGASSLTALEQAVSVASIALELAERTGAVRERVAALVTLARCCFLQGDEAAAEKYAHSALVVTEEGATGLARLMGQEAEDLPPLLRSPDLDLHRLFALKVKLELPALEWRAHYMEGVLKAKRLGPEAAYPSLHASAQIVCRILSGLTQNEALTFQKQHPAITAVFQDLQRAALTEDTRRETRALLDSARLVPSAEAVPALAAGH